jgi:hypothetical protein
VQTQIGPHHAANAADIFGLLWASSTILPVGNGETSFPLTPRVGKMDIGEAGGRNFHGRWFSVGSNFVCHTSALSWHCDSVLGLALLPTPCVSLLPWPLKGNFLLANTTVCAVDMQYHVGQTTRERPKLRGPSCGSIIGLSLEKAPRLGHGLQKLGISALEGQSDIAHQSAWLDVRDFVLT